MSCVDIKNNLKLHWNCEKVIWRILSHSTLRFCWDSQRWKDYFCTKKKLPRLWLRNARMASWFKFSRLVLLDCVTFYHSMMIIAVPFLLFMSYLNRSFCYQHKLASGLKWNVPSSWTSNNFTVHYASFFLSFSLYIQQKWLQILHEWVEFFNWKRFAEEKFQGGFSIDFVSFNGEVSLWIRLHFKWRENFRKWPKQNLNQSGEFEQPVMAFLTVVSEFCISFRLKNRLRWEVGLVNVIAFFLRIFIKIPDVFF